MTAVRAALGSRYAGFALLLAGLAACEGVECGVGMRPSVPPPDPVGREASRGCAGRRRHGRGAEREQTGSAGEATQEDIDRARRRAAVAATELQERADRARAWTDDFPARVTAANDCLPTPEAASRAAAGAGLNVEGPKDTTPWGLLSWAISTGLLVVLNEKRKREAKAVLSRRSRRVRTSPPARTTRRSSAAAGRSSPNTASPTRHPVSTRSRPHWRPPAC